jgi:hypothetical protein
MPGALMHYVCQRLLPGVFCNKPALLFQKNCPRYFQKPEKISEETIFKNLFFQNNKNPHLMVLREEATVVIMIVFYQFIKFEKY